MAELPDEALERALAQEAQEEARERRHDFLRRMDYAYRPRRGEGARTSRFLDMVPEINASLDAFEAGQGPTPFMRVMREARREAELLDPVLYYHSFYDATDQRVGNEPDEAQELFDLLQAFSTPVHRRRAHQERTSRDYLDDVISAAAQRRRRGLGPPHQVHRMAFDESTAIQRLAYPDAYLPTERQQRDRLRTLERRLASTLRRLGRAREREVPDAALEARIAQDATDLMERGRALQRSMQARGWHAPSTDLLERARRVAQRRRERGRSLSPPRSSAHHR